MATLLRSQLVCPLCDDLISSINVHDFQTCRCAALSIDGGREYIRVAANDEVMEMIVEQGLDQWDRSISIAGEHDNASAAIALKVYKALWVASSRGEDWATAAQVRAMTGPRLSEKTVTAYLQALYDDDGPVIKGKHGDMYIWRPRVPLHERTDA